MPGEDPTSRRRFLLSSLAVLGAGEIGACKNREASGFACTDLGGLPEADVAARTAMAYVERAPDGARECGRCVQFMGTYDGCGACKVIRGPIHPKGTCKIFAANG
ncbi:MAG TPA: hypothetical protein VHE30_08980 [Polyangiaceae bacterium]|nr:hypothetical protein [Polyangiaceae bacterium]